MTDIRNSNFVYKSRVRDVINNVGTEMAITEEQWRRLTKFAAVNETENELGQIREVEFLLKDGKKEEARQVWGQIRSFFDSNLARAANIAQIVGTIDGLTR